MNKKEFEEVFVDEDYPEYIIDCVPIRELWWWIEREVKEARINELNKILEYKQETIDIITTIPSFAVKERHIKNRIKELE